MAAPRSVLMSFAGMPARGVLEHHCPPLLEDASSVYQCMFDLRQSIVFGRYAAPVDLELLPILA